MARYANMCRLIVEIEGADQETLRQAGLAVIALCEEAGVHPADAADAMHDICECISLELPVSRKSRKADKIWARANDLAREICCAGWPADRLPREPLRIHYYHLTADGKELPVEAETLDGLIQAGLEYEKARPREGAGQSGRKRP